MVEGEDRAVLVDCDTVALKIWRWRPPREPAPLLFDARVEDGSVTWRDEGGHDFRIVAQGISDEALAEVAWSVIAHYGDIDAFWPPIWFEFPDIPITTVYPPTNPPRPVTTR